MTRSYAFNGAISACSRAGSVTPAQLLARMHGVQTRILDVLGTPHPSHLQHVAAAGLLQLQRVDRPLRIDDRRANHRAHALRDGERALGRRARR